MVFAYNDCMENKCLSVDGEERLIFGKQDCFAAAGCER